MLRACRGLSGFALFILAWGLALTVAAGLAQEAAKGPLVYNVRTVETLKGLVISLSPQAYGGMPEPVVLRLATDKETLTVWLGPNWYVEAQGLKIVALDRVEVTGSRLMLDGKPAILAAQVKKDGQVLKLRDDHGTPLWGKQPPARE